MKARVGLLAAGLILCGGCGGDEEERASGRSSTRPAPETAPDGTITVPLVEENNSGASGRATLSGAGGSASVTIELDGDDKPYQAHIHDVSCARYRRMNDFSAQLASVTEGLNSVVGGRSASDLREPVSAYTRAQFSINVHETASPYPVVACGDLSAP